MEIRRNNWIGGPRGRGRDTDVGIVLKAHEGKGLIGVTSMRRMVGL